MGFNPRPRTGGDHYEETRQNEYVVFQSTPPHGGRLGPLESVEVLDPFQSTPPHGGRQKAFDRKWKEVGFNPRPRTGGDCSFITF